MTVNLQDRMQRYTPGQVTWPDLNRDRNCAECSFFYTGDAKFKGSGRCDLVRKYHKTIGAQFRGAEAIACPKFKVGTHEENKL